MSTRELIAEVFCGIAFFALLCAMWYFALVYNHYSVRCDIDKTTEQVFCPNEKEVSYD